VSYLPRKFKTALALDGDNCVDVYANDLGLVAIADRNAGLAGFNVLVGGGLGRTANKPETFPAVAQSLGFVSPDRAIAVARAVVAVQRDHGDRGNRRHARLKYLVHDRGLDWFRAQVEAEAGFQLQKPRPMQRLEMHDHLGWNPGWYGLFVENGRIEDLPGHALRSALREAVERFHSTVYLTAQQNVLLAGVEDRPALEAIFRQHGVPLTEELSPTLRHSMACPALPTCGLAVAESERALPTLIRRLEALVLDLGLETEQISYRMTGCPNGCARPYLGDVGFVGTTLGKYDVYLGGDFTGTRLNRLFARNVPLAEIPALLEGPLSAFGAERRAAEGFGDWCERVGVDALRERFEEAAG
jgi:sulfite reductase (ferredoxin)